MLARKFFEDMAQLKYLGTTVPIKTCVHDEITSR